MQTRRDRLWRFRTLRPGDYAAILLVIALAAAALVGLVKIPFKGNAPGFGPDWDCSYAGQGDPVCIKKSPKNSN